MEVPTFSVATADPRDLCRPHFNQTDTENLECPKLAAQDTRFKTSASGEENFTSLPPAYSMTQGGAAPNAGGASNSQPPSPRVPRGANEPHMTEALITAFDPFAKKPPPWALAILDRLWVLSCLTIGPTEAPGKDGDLTEGLWEVADERPRTAIVSTVAMTANRVRRNLGWSFLRLFIMSVSFT